MIKKKRCSSSEDFYDMYMKNAHEFEGTKTLEYAHDRVSMKNAKDVWESLFREGEQCFLKQGYLDILYNVESNSYSGKKTRGRPHMDASKDNRMTVRFEKRQLEALEDYCQAQNIRDKSEVVRDAIEKYITSPNKHTK